MPKHEVEKRIVDGLAAIERRVASWVGSFGDGTGPDRIAMEHVRATYLLALAYLKPIVTYDGSRE